MRGVLESTDDLLFTDAKDIPSETLFTFFRYITASKEYDENYQQKWYSAVDNKFHVPVAEVTDIVNKYFDGINFDATKVIGYDPETNYITADILSGFGGTHFPKLANKEKIFDDTLRLTVDFYDPEYKIVYYTKVYIIRLTDAGYQYLSITKP